MLSALIHLNVCYFSESAVDRQISFPLSPAHNVEIERNGKPGMDDLNEEMQNMDVEEPQCEFEMSCEIFGKLTLLCSLFYRFF